jgi:hypothetical protein
MRRALWILVGSATVSVPSLATAQVDPAKVILGGWGILAVSSVGRVIRGNGDADVWPGSRIRIRFGGDTLVGRVASLSTDSLVLEMTGSTRVLSTADIRDVQVSVGPQSRWAQGFLSGFALGGAGGALLGFASGNDKPGWFSMTSNEKAVFFGATFAFYGSLAGTITGSLISREGWANGRQPAREGSIVVVPVVGRRSGVAARLTF